MSLERKIGVGTCVYCGQWRALTRDHVPPKSLFSKPRPSDLITVPSCLACNKGASKDDEYFRLMVQMGINREKFPDENSNSINAINRLAAPERLAFARYLLGKRRGSAFVVDRKRIGAVLHRITKGLYYHHTDTRLADNTRFRFISIQDERRRAEEMAEVIQFLAQNQIAIASGKFRYSSIFDAGTAAWLMSFYDHREFLCFVDRIGHGVGQKLPDPAL